MEEKNKIEVYINEQTKEEQIKTPMLDYATNDEGYMEYITRIFEQPIQIGEVLLDFIQRDLKENSYMIFRFYGFQTLLSKEERNNLLATDINNSDNMKRKMEQLYVKYMGEFKDYKKQIIDIIEFCLFNENTKMKDLKPLERLVVFTSTKDIKEYIILKYNNFKQSIRLNKDMSRMKEEQIINTLQDKDNNRYGIQEIYEIDNFYNLLFLELYFILLERTYLKKCKNCGKYFLTTNSAVIYCNNVYEANKTCREIGASKVFSKNLEKDEAYSLYRKVYKKKQALAKSKGGSFEIEYNMFKYKGKDKKNAYKLKEITKKEFMDWLRKQ